MSLDGLFAAVDSLLVDALGYDWYDFRQRLDRWVQENPEKALEMVEYTRQLLEVWDRG